MTAFKKGDRVVRNSTPHAFSSMPNHHFHEAEEGEQGKVESVSNAFSRVRYSVRWDSGIVSAIEASGIDLAVDNSKAIRGVENLLPGLYVTHYRSFDEYFFLTDTEIERRAGIGRELVTIRCYGLDGQKKKVFLGDAGIVPRNEGKTQTCNLGHEHAAEPVYSTAWTERVDIIPTV